MAGMKYVINHLESELAVEFLVRQGSDPANDSAVVHATVAPQTTMIVPYGDAEDIYLNATVLDATVEGQTLTKRDQVLARGTKTDDALNTNNTIDVRFANGDFAVVYLNS